VVGISRLASVRPTSSTTAAAWVSLWLSTPTVTTRFTCGMVTKAILLWLRMVGWHAPAGRADKTVRGLRDRLL
jgi:DUF1365 family protein